MSDPQVSVILPIILHPSEPLMVPLTRAAIEVMRLTTAVPHQLIVVESVSHHEWLADLCDIYMHRPERRGYVADFLAAQNIARGDYIVQVANDMIMATDWLEAMLECFDKAPFCGMATVSAGEPGAIVGSRAPLDVICEGHYGPLMMWPKELAGKPLRFDERLIGGYSDQDLLMQVYDRGYRSYRNNRVCIFHINRLTQDAAWNRPFGQAHMAHGQRIFMEKWANHPMNIRKIIERGHVVWGREHE